MIDAEHTATSASIHDHDEQIPLVSIVITCYNQGRFLDEAIQSARQQTYPNVEIIVVDDGSTDDTRSVAQAAEVAYIWQLNQGLAAARNRGLVASRGDYVMFLDADDRLLSHAAETGMSHLVSHSEAAFVSGGYQLIAVDGSFRGPGPTLQLSDDRYKALLRGNYIGMHAAVLYRRAALEAVGGFDPSLAACEDYDLYLRLARHHVIVSHAAVVAEYRIHDQNMSRDARLMYQSCTEVLRRQRRHAQGNTDYRSAWNDGQFVLTSTYGRKLENALMTALIQRQWRQSASMAWFLARRYPYGLLQVLHNINVPQVCVRQFNRLWRRSTIEANRQIHFGDLRRITPFSREFGFDRGQPVDRYYIDGFLSQYRADVRGHVLEVGDNTYTRRFGGSQVTRSDVLHVTADNPHATLVGDLTQPETLPPNSFDCIILTQTLHLIYDLHAALRTLRASLKAGGVLLITVPGISQLSADEWNQTWCWSLTDRGLSRLLHEHGETDRVTITTYGNVLTATALLYGLAASELQRDELDAHDPLYQVIVAARVTRATSDPSGSDAEDCRPRL